MRVGGGREEAGRLEIMRKMESIMRVGLREGCKVRIQEKRELVLGKRRRRGWCKVK